MAQTKEKIASPEDVPAPSRQTVISSLQKRMQGLVDATGGKLHDLQHELFPSDEDKRTRYVRLASSLAQYLGPQLDRDSNDPFWNAPITGPYKVKSQYSPNEYPPLEEVMISHHKAEVKDMEEYTSLEEQGIVFQTTPRQALRTYLQEGVFGENTSATRTAEYLLESYMEESIIGPLVKRYGRSDLTTINAIAMKVADDIKSQVSKMVGGGLSPDELAVELIAKMLAEGGKFAMQPVSLELTQKDLLEATAGGEDTLLGILRQPTEEERELHPLVSELKQNLDIMLATKQMQAVLAIGRARGYKLADGIPFRTEVRTDTEGKITKDITEWVISHKSERGPGDVKVETYTLAAVYDVPVGRTEYGYPATNKKVDQITFSVGTRVVEPGRTIHYTPEQRRGLEVDRLPLYARLAARSAETMLVNAGPASEALANAGEITDEWAPVHAEVLLERLLDGITSRHEVIDLRFPPVQIVAPQPIAREEFFVSSQGALPAGRRLVSN